MIDAATRVSTLNNIDSLYYTKLKNTLLLNEFKKASMLLIFTALNIQSDSISVTNTEINDYCNDFIASLRAIPEEIQSMNSLLQGTQIPAFLLIQKNSFPDVMTANGSYTNKIYYTNAGNLVAQKHYLKIKVDSTLIRVNRDSINLGNVLQGKNDSIELFITTRNNQKDTFTSVNFYLFNQYNELYGFETKFIKILGNTTKVNEQFTIDNWVFFPNPTTAKITLKQTNTFAEGPLSINVSNSVGQVVWQQKVGNVDGYVIDLGDKPNGLYIIKVSQQDGRFQTEKVVIQH